MSRPVDILLGISVYSRLEGRGEKGRSFRMFLGIWDIDDLQGSSPPVIKV